MRSTVHTRSSAHVKMDNGSSLSSSIGGPQVPASWQGGKCLDGVENSHVAMEGQPLLHDPLVITVTADPRGEQVNAEALYSKINWALLPLFFVIVISSYIDRTNLAFAALQLNEDLSFTPQVYGMGSGLFFLGYAAFQIPSNLILRKVGGANWLSFIVLMWGICATSFSMVRTVRGFYALRLLLGITEAGAIPGMWHILTRWYPKERLTIPFAVVESAIAVSHTIAAPLAAACLSMDGLSLFGTPLRGWQWLFFLEGIPSMMLAFCIKSRLPDSPETASFLSPAERAYLAVRLSPGGGQAGGGPSTWEVMMGAVRNGYVWYMGAMKFLKDVATFGIIFWTPTLIRAILDGTSIKLDLPEEQEQGGEEDALQPHGRRRQLQAAGKAVAGAASWMLAAVPGGAVRQLLTGDQDAGQDPALAAAALPAPEHHKLGISAVLLTSVPFGLAALASLALAHHSDHKRERVLHLAIPFMITGLLLAAFPAMVNASLALGFIALTCGVVGVYAGAGIALSLLSELAAGPSLVAALPLYNSLGNFGGFVGPVMVGALVAQTHSFALPTMLMGGSLFLAGSMVLAMRFYDPRIGILPEKTRTGTDSKSKKVSGSGVGSSVGGLDQISGGAGIGMVALSTRS